MLFLLTNTSHGEKPMLTWLHLFDIVRQATTFVLNLWEESGPEGRTIVCEGMLLLLTSLTKFARSRVRRWQHSHKNRDPFVAA
jgi:hypothetical protein